MRKKIILLILLLISIFMIGAVSASNNTDNGVLDSSNKCSVVEKTHNTNKKVNDKNPVIRKKHTNDIVNKDIIKSSRDENKLLSDGDVKVKAKRIGTNYKNTRIIARFVYSNGSAFANSPVRITAFESNTADVYHNYKSQNKILKTDKNGWINYNIPWMPTTWDIDYYSWDKDLKDWNYIGTKLDFKIKYLNAKIIAPSQSLFYYDYDDEKLSVRIMDTNNHPLKNVKVTFAVDDEEKSTLKTNSKGYVYFKTNDLKVGNHESTLSLEYDPIYSAYVKDVSIKIKSEDLSRPTRKYLKIAKQSSKKDRTFNIGKYKITLSKTEYAKFLYIPEAEKYLLKNYYYYEGGEDFGCYRVSESYTDSGDSELGLYYYIRKPTKYFIKQKIGYDFIGYKLTKLKSFKSHKKAINYKKTAKKKYYTVKIKYDQKSKKYIVYKQTEKYKKVVTKKARVYMDLEYGESQGGYPKKYTLYTFTDYENPGYDVVSGYTPLGYKLSRNIKTLNKAKLRYD